MPSIPESISAFVLPGLPHVLHSALHRPCSNMAESEEGKKKEQAEAKAAAAAAKAWREAAARKSAAAAGSGGFGGLFRKKSSKVAPADDGRMGAGLQRRWGAGQHQQRGLHSCGVHPRASTTDSLDFCPALPAHLQASCPSWCPSRPARSRRAARPARGTTPARTSTSPTRSTCTGEGGRLHRGRQATL